jgi:hypothetical protein
MIKKDNNLQIKEEKLLILVVISMTVRMLMRKKMTINSTTTQNRKMQKPERVELKMSKAKNWKTSLTISQLM